MFRCPTEFNKISTKEIIKTAYIAFSNRRWSNFQERTCMEKVQKLELFGVTKEQKKFTLIGKEILLDFLFRQQIYLHKDSNNLKREKGRQIYRKN